MGQYVMFYVDKEGQLRDNMKCTNCELCNSSRLVTNCMEGSGPKPCEIMFIGFAPADEDDRIGRPMTGKGGRIFRELIQEAGFTSNEVYITNSLKCTPYDIKAKPVHFEKCKKHFFKEVQEVKPKVIVTVGSSAFNWLTGQSGVRDFKRQGLPCKYFPEIMIYPIVQPAAVFYGNFEEKQATRNSIMDQLHWIKRKLESGGIIEVDDTDTDYKMAHTLQDVYDFMVEIDNAEVIAVDLETATEQGEMALFPEDGNIPVAFGFSTGPGHGRAIPLYAWGSLTKWYWADDELAEILKLLKERLKDKPLFGHNWLQFDQKWIKHFLGIDRTNVVFDTMLGHYLTWEEKNTHDLEQLTLRFTKMGTWKKTFTLKDIHGTCNYLCKDVDATFRIKAPIEERMTEKQKQLMKNLIIPLGHTLMEMEYRGVDVDTEGFEKLKEHLDSRINDERMAIRSMPETQAYELEQNTEFRESGKGLAILMEKYFKFPVIVKTKSGAYSTAKETLDALKDKPFVQHLEQLRGLTKLRGTYTQGMIQRLKKDGKIHTSFLIHGTETGRLASRNPNLQNIPTEGTVGQVLADPTAIKSAFKASDGYNFLEIDFSQAELRVLAVYSGDENLINMFKRGEDAHTSTAAKAYGVPLDKVTSVQRRFAKTINFGIVYGMGEESLIYKFVSSGGTEKEAREFMKLHRREFAKVYEWMDEQVNIIRKEKEQETFFGLKRHYDVIDGHAIRQAYNYKIQSVAGTYTLFTLVRTDRVLKELEYDAFPVLTVHDSILYNVKDEQIQDAAEVVKHIAENMNFPWMTVPMRVDLKTGVNWGSLQKFK